MEQQGLEQRRYEPQVRRYATPLLLLHGAWHGAWCWESAVTELLERGFVVHSFSLRGHGQSHSPRALNLCGADDYVHDLHAVIEALEARPVVVGHSMGGYVLQRYLQVHDLPGAVLLASIPVGGAAGFALRWSRRHPLALLRTLLTLNMRNFVRTRRLTRAAFLRRDAARGLVRHVAAQLGPESLRILVDVSLTKLPKPRLVRSPLLVVAAEHDAVFTLEEQERTAAAYGVPLHVIPAAAHDLMFDPAWPRVVDLIEQSVIDWTSGATQRDAGRLDCSQGGWLAAPC